MSSFTTVYLFLCIVSFSFVCPYWICSDEPTYGVLFSQPGIQSLQKMTLRKIGWSKSVSSPLRKCWWDSFLCMNVCDFISNWTFFFAFLFMLFFGIVSLNSIMFQAMVFELSVIKKERKKLKETTHQWDIFSIENILDIFRYFDFDWIRFFGPSLPCSFSSIHFPSFGQHDWGRITIRSWGLDLLPEHYHSFQVFSFFRLCTSGFLVDSSL